MKKAENNGEKHFFNFKDNLFDLINDLIKVFADG